VPLPFSLVHALTGYNRAQGEERIEAGATYASRNLVFATSEGGCYQSPTLCLALAIQVGPLARLNEPGKIL